MWKALMWAGEPVGRGRVEWLIRSHGICGAKRRGRPWRTTVADREGQRRRPDVVERDFTASGRDELNVADPTCLRCWQGVVFFAFVIDVFGRRIVGWLSSREVVDAGGIGVDPLDASPEHDAGRVLERFSVCDIVLTITSHP